jgi:hypothetical protein
MWVEVDVDEDWRAEPSVRAGGAVQEEAEETAGGFEHLS